MFDVEKKFYVLRAVSGKESKVKEYLETEIKKNDRLKSCISRVIVPTEKLLRSYGSGKKYKKERVFFPGYVVVEAILNSEVIRFIKNTNFVAGFLGHDNPVPLLPFEVDRILGKMDKIQSRSEEFSINYVIGEAVKIIFGPFTGFRGEIDEIYSDKKRLKVMVKIFGRKSPIELGYLQVEKE
ncbi:MAG: transcription termination/antitermination protein NusG [Bacteroidales bacterium OttesenSCG-928-I14]|jgi:transcriptional antiterminator NusG|nr:transcription termination/antitermination protein NusG [Bacteroidales bacterium OttesenSCG-928-I14]